MADRPEEFPEWALVEETDPVSGQSNIVEPPESYKNSGWTRAQIPPRQWFNWLLRRIYDWLFFLDFEDSEIRKEENKKYATLVARNWFATSGLSGSYTLQLAAGETKRPVCWGDSGFVAVFGSASPSRAAVSKAGDFWSGGDLSGTYDWVSVGYSSGLDLYAAGAIGVDARVATSQDGESWSAPQVIAGMGTIQDIAGVSFGVSDYLLVAGVDGSIRPTISWSPDGSAWTSYQLGSGYRGMILATNGRKDAEGRVIAVTVDTSGSGAVLIFGLTDIDEYEQIGSISTPDIDIGASIDTAPAIEYDELNGVYVLLLVEDSGSGNYLSMHTSPDASNWTKVAEFMEGAPTIGRLLYAPEIGAMIVTIDTGDLYMTTDYVNIPRIDWTPGGDAAYPHVAWSPVHKNFVAIKAGDTSTDTLTLRSL